MKNRLTEIIASSRRRGPTYLFREDFEGTGAPAGWTFDGTGSCTYDLTAGGFGQCVSCSSNTDSSLGGAQKSLAGLGITQTHGFYCRVLFGSTSGAINRDMWITNQTWFTFWATPPYQRWRNGALAFGLTGATWYHLWLDATPTLLELRMSTSGTRPASPMDTRSGSFSAPTRMSICTNHGSGVRVDKIRFASGPIGSNPP